MPTSSHPQDEAIEKDAKKKRKQKRVRRRVRAAWISFIGRIVAQFVGSAASIVLALVVVGRHHPAAEQPTASAAFRPAATPISAPTTTQPGPVIIVLALDQLSGDARGDLAGVLDAAVARSLPGGALPTPPESSQDRSPLPRRRLANPRESLVARTLDAPPEARR